MTYTVSSGTLNPSIPYHTIHSNHGPISHRFRDKLRFQSKILQNFPPRVFCAPADVVSFGIWYRRTESRKETRMMKLPEGKKVLRLV